VGNFLAGWRALILLVILCLPICYSTTIGTLGLVIRTPVTFVCKFRVEWSGCTNTYLEISVGCHPAAFKNVKTVPLPLSKRNPELKKKKKILQTLKVRTVML